MQNIYCNNINIGEWTGCCDDDENKGGLKEMRR
jgi:hypothetical protein